MSGNEIRTYLNVLNESALAQPVIFDKIQRLLYTYTVGILRIPEQYKPSLKATLDSGKFHVSELDIVYREARNLQRREQTAYDYDDVFDPDEFSDYLWAAIDDATSAVMAAIINHMQAQFDVTLAPVSVPEHDIQFLADAVYKLYKQPRQ
jgi:hypothetical protein